MESIAPSIKEFIRENFLFGKGITFSDDDSFLEMGLIDSTGVLELVTFLESTFGIRVGDEELLPQNLDSINRITHFVGSKRHAKAV